MTWKDLDPVALQLKALQTEWKESSTFPKTEDDKEVCRLVQKCVDNMWDDSDGILKRRNFNWDWDWMLFNMQRIRDLLDEAYFVPCSLAGYTEKIHSLRVLVYHIISHGKIRTGKLHTHNAL